MTDWTPSRGYCKVPVTVPGCRSCRVDTVRQSSSALISRTERIAPALRDAAILVYGTLDFGGQSRVRRVELEINHVEPGGALTFPCSVFLRA